MGIEDWRLPRIAPTLVELCTRTVIDNLRYVGDVSGLELTILGNILPHCTIKQLAHIESCSKDTDLSPVTDELWKRFYASQFGAESVANVMKKMQKKQVRFLWKDLFDAKTRDQEEQEREIGARIKQKYAESLAKKQSRQTKVCSKIPPTKKRSFFGGESSTFNCKSPIIKKAKKECLRSPEAAMRMQKKTILTKSAPRPPTYSGDTRASASSYISKQKGKFL